MKFLKNTLFYPRALALSFVSILPCFSLAAASDRVEITPREIVHTYGDIALATYDDALKGAQALQKAVDEFLANPSKAGLDKAKQAWIAARIPYQQSEVFRFSNPVVDAWEGRVNSWPLDEGLIDYVDANYGNESDENSLYSANIIANKSIEINGKMIDASHITPQFLAKVLHEAGGVEANVATGYHAIEFLLWGQDLNGTNKGAGNRPFSDYLRQDCTHDNCDRRREYLKSAVDLLVDDLEEMVANWLDTSKRSQILNWQDKQGLAAILKSMGSLSYGELAGERMKLGLLLHDPEEEQDCFSDNTHASHFNDVKGIQNIYLGRYTRTDGTIIQGPSLYQFIALGNPALANELHQEIAITITRMNEISDAAQNGEAYDMQIGEGNKKGNARVQAAIDALIAQTKSIERAISVLKLGKVSIEGSDSLDKQDAVFQ